MSLEKLIENSNKEIVGSRTKNRLTVQISYALELVMEFYPYDFIVLMDYIEDVVVITDPLNSSKIHLYQIKTKSSDKQYLLTTVVGDKWFQKLYSNATNYEHYLSAAAVVCNTDIVNSGSAIFPNSKTVLTDPSIQSNIQKIRHAIAKDQQMNDDEVDLSKIYFIRSTLSTKGHKDEVAHKFGDFLFQKDKNVQLATIKAVYALLYDDLDNKFNQEISENCTDINEIYSQKGMSSKDIKHIIDCGLAIQIPEPDRLFAEFNVVSILERRKYTSAYRQIKLDMYSEMSCFINLQGRITAKIEMLNNSGIDVMPTLLDAVYNDIITEGNIPIPYNDEYYLKILIMILIFKYCYGEI